MEMGGGSGGLLRRLGHCAPRIAPLMLVPIITVRTENINSDAIGPCSPGMRLAPMFLVKIIYFARHSLTAVRNYNGSCDHRL